MQNSDFGQAYGFARMVNRNKGNTFGVATFTSNKMNNDDNWYPVTAQIPEWLQPIGRSRPLQFSLLTLIEVTLISCALLGDLFYWGHNGIWVGVLLLACFFLRRRKWIPGAVFLVVFFGQS